MDTFIVLIVFIALSAGLVWYFVSHDKGTKEPIGGLWIALGFGGLAAVAAALLENALIPAQNLSFLTNSLGGILVSALAIGLIEEGCKFIPYALFVFKRPYFNENTDGIIYFTIVGLGFGLPENILYTLNFGGRTGAVRLVLTPFFHAATTGMVGFFLARHKVSKSPFYTVILALLAAMILHGLYDFGLSSGRLLFVVMSLMITLGMSVGLFIFYMLATERDQDMGLARVKGNNFCRSCGAENPNGTLFCTHCGKHA